MSGLGKRADRGNWVNEKELRRVEAPVRVNSEELKLVDAASFLRPLCQVQRNGMVGKWRVTEAFLGGANRFLRVAGGCGRSGGARRVLCVDVIVD